jgi:hypothetical protein
LARPHSPGDARSGGTRAAQDRLRRAPVAIALFGALAFVGGSLSPLGGLLDDSQTGDIPLYRDYGAELLDGEVPYRDFFVEYPPLALPVFVVPALAEDTSAALAFKALATGLGVAALGLVVLALHAVRASPLRIVGAVALIASAPIALGPVLLTRYDLWPATLAVGALAALVAGFPRLGVTVLAGAVAAKVYPIVAVPLVFAYFGRRFGRDMSTRTAAWGTCVLAACVLPFLALGPGGIRYSASFQLSRPLHVESLGGSLLLAAHHAGALEAKLESSFNSENLAGPGADAVAWASSALQWIAVLAVWVLFARGPRRSQDLMCAAAAAVCGFVAFGKVLSPQFLVWLLPLAGLVAQRALAASLLLVVALVLTRSLDHWDGIGFSAAGWLVLARNLALVTLFALLVKGPKSTETSCLDSGIQARPG